MDLDQVAYSEGPRCLLQGVYRQWPIKQEASEKKHPDTIADRKQAARDDFLVWGNVFMA